MLVDDIADLLSTGGMSNVTKGGLYGTADPTVAVIPVGGRGSLHAMRSSPGLAIVERPRMQIVTRSASQQTAMLQAQSAYKLLDGVRERQINGIRYLWAAAAQNPFPMERDENSRYLMAFNVDVIRERST